MVFQLTFGDMLGITVSEWAEIRFASRVGADMIRQRSHTFAHFLTIGTLHECGLRVRSNVSVQIVGQIECLFTACKVAVESELIGLGRNSIILND